MDQAPGPARRHLDELQGSRPVAAQTARGANDLRQVPQAFERVQVRDHDAVGQGGVRNARQRPIIGTLPEQPPCAGALPGHGHVDPVVHRIGHDPEHGHPVLDESQRDRPVPVDGHIVQGAVDRVENPDPAVPGINRVPLFAQQRIAHGRQALGDERLDAAIHLGDDVVAVALGVNPQLLARVEPEARARADGVEGRGK